MCMGALRVSACVPAARGSVQRVHARSTAAWRVRVCRAMHAPTHRPERSCCRAKRRRAAGAEGRRCSPERGLRMQANGGDARLSVQCAQPAAAAGCPCPLPSVMMAAPGCCCCVPDGCERLVGLNCRPPHAQTCCCCCPNAGADAPNAPAPNAGAEAAWPKPAGHAGMGDHQAQLRARVVPPQVLLRQPYWMHAAQANNHAPPKPPGAPNMLAGWEGWPRARGLLSAQAALRVRAVHQGLHQVWKAASSLCAPARMCTCMNTRTHARTRTLAHAQAARPRAQQARSCGSAPCGMRSTGNMRSTGGSESGGCGLAHYISRTARAQPMCLYQHQRALWKKWGATSSSISGWMAVTPCGAALGTRWVWQRHPRRAGMLRESTAPTNTACEHQGRRG